MVDIPERSGQSEKISAARYEKIAAFGSAYKSAV
jgi:hypothetical protein